MINISSNNFGHQANSKASTQTISMEDKSNPCTYLKNSGGFNRIQTHDLSDASAMVYQLSYEAMGAGQFVGLMCSCERTNEGHKVYLKCWL